jgi:hypothetical protein
LCLFIGHGRSGSTLVGALLNAHPNIVMSNELDVLRHIQRDLSEEQLLNLIYYEAKRHTRRGSPGGGGYTYAVPNQWQGKHRDIMVIGDRKAGSTSIQLFRQPDLLTRLVDTIRLPIRFICVVRNPFDTIATTLRKTPRLEGETEGEHLHRQVERYFERWAAICQLVASVGSDSVAFVPHEALIDDPAGVLVSLCNFLAVPAPPEYLSDCAAIVRRDPHVTRSSIDWTGELVNLVKSRAKEIPWLKHYEY